MEILLMKELEKVVITESRKAAASHHFNHFLRVARGAEWFCSFIGASRHEIQIACAAGLLHDIVRPPTEKYDPLEDAMKKSKEILENMGIDQKLIREILDAIRSHHYPDPKKKSGYAVFLADKILEGMGAYIVFRRAIFMGESPDFVGMNRNEATLEHWTARINKWPSSGFYRGFAKLVDYQFSWCSRFLDAFKNSEEWAVRLNDAGLDAGTNGIPTDAMLASFKPKFKEENEFMDEALSYIQGKKFGSFENLIKNPLL